MTQSHPSRGAAEPALIPVCDLKAQTLALSDELSAAARRVMAGGWFILGREVEAFEAEFAGFVGCGHAVGVASGTDALQLALRALDIGHGDRVLTAPNSAVPTAVAVCQAGAVPVFADVDPLTGLLTPQTVSAALEPGIRAVIPVHLYGRCADMESILELCDPHGIHVIEDAAQAHGASRGGRMAGSFGPIGCFSFYPSKNLGALGDGGACVTDDPDLAARLRRLRCYGERDRYESVEIGVNSRLDEMQAAFLRVKLGRLDAWNRRRRDIAAIYRERLQNLPLILPPGDPDGMEVVHLFVVQVAARDRLREELLKRGVGTQIHYPVPIHMQEAFRHMSNGPGSFPAAEARAKRILSLPLYPEMTDSQIERVIEALSHALAGEPHPEEIEC